MSAAGRSNRPRLDIPAVLQAANDRFAVVFDLSADYQLNPETTLTFYVAHASGKAVVRNVYERGPNANFAYVELNRRF
jgi:hypothetical protein